MLLNIIIDFVMLIAMALVSISGFILEIVIPSRHAVRFQSVTPWSSHLFGLGRHDWGNIHLWAGVVLFALLAIHILSHINMVSAFVKKKCPNHILRVLLYILFLMLLIITIMPWLYLCY
ncbi:DUF4405 domain-containing protein [Bacteroides thetaiotaomicron]|jgi:hypothetical protein|nr:DUF4405 domain-containing protein [Bacteroides thetaiotaomicron]MCS2747225.1 DUF4405 domain-containing protein [Bacteroides thetaiotaomicron]MCS3001556.1 DUF4405 domain-containing protein [Bacteroides thetaiotaomicron]MDC2178671.1 DUF4405 domain-containing protein [Bacteroides thetaiotaomicron]UVV82883.1 DUF4405 domain-containing protein [Bacteroides thetaiotaomicron]